MKESDENHIRLKREIESLKLSLNLWEKGYLHYHNTVGDISLLDYADRNAAQQINEIEFDTINWLADKLYSEEGIDKNLLDEMKLIAAEIRWGGR